MLQKRNAYVTAVQKERLVDYVTENYGILFGKEPYRIGEPTKDELWNALAVELNAIGSVKDLNGWKRCYTAMKSSTNKKLKNCANQTGAHGLNSYEVKIINANQSILSNVLRTITLPSNTQENHLQKGASR